ncbi:MAG: secretin N-terminal domain-containing protein [Gammaproteobacteria bacterium]
MMNKHAHKTGRVRSICALSLLMLIPVAVADINKVISINVLDMDIAEVMAMLATKEQVNILVNNGVEGEISLNLYDVTVKDAIQAAARAGGYAAERMGDTFYIDKPDDVGSRYKSSITTVRTFNIRYSDPEKVKTILEEYLSDYGAVSVLEDRNILVVEDTPEHIKRVSTILKSIDDMPRQILIEAKILEITLSDSNAYGINWTRVFSGGETVVGVQGLTSPASGLFIDRLTDNFQASLEALYLTNDVRTLSSPNLVARENTEASVIIGDRQGYRVTTTINQVTTESIEFLESGVILRVLPNIDEFGNIMMQIHPEVSTGFISTDGIPSQQTTEVTTEILTRDGQPIFIGGLIKNNLTDGKTGVPFLGKIPVVGALFSSRTRASNNTETVVLISPYVVGGKAHQLMLEKSARVQHQQKRLNAELDRIGSEMDIKADDAAAVERESYDNDWDDPRQDEDLWGDDSYF